MARTLNRTELIGNVGRDPEFHVAGHGAPVAHFSLATNRRIKRDHGFYERTDWHRITCWGRLAEYVREHVRKGDRLYLTGRIEYGSFVRDGETIPTADIIARELIFIGDAGPSPADYDTHEEPDECLE